MRKEILTKVDNVNIEAAKELLRALRVIITPEELHKLKERIDDTDNHDEQHDNR